MKNKLQILILVFGIICFFTECYPQNNDTLKKGTFYSFTLNNGTVIKGKVISFDTSVIMLKTKNGLDEIQRKNILNMYKAGNDFSVEYFSTYKKPEYRKYLSINIGFISPNFTNDDNFYYNSSYDGKSNNGIYISLIYTGFFSRSLGVRTGISYSLMKNKDVYWNNGYYTFSRTEGKLSKIEIGLDMLAGIFHPEKKINFYALSGIGFGSANSSEMTRNDYSYSDTFNPEPQILFKYGFGGGLTYRLSEKYALQSEICYDYISPERGFYGKTTQLTIKAGIIFINF